MSNGVAALVAVLVLNGLWGMALAFNVWRASEWLARRGANIPRWLRLPGQANAQVYRVTGGLQLALSCIALVWIAVRLR